MFESLSPASRRIVFLLSVASSLGLLSLSAPAQTGLQFNGSTQYVTFGRSPGFDSLGVRTFTIECWFKRIGTGVTTSTGTGGLTAAIPLVTKGRGEAESPRNLNCNYFLGINGNVIAADFEDTTTGLNHPISGVATITNGVWYHAAATYDGTTWKLYLNGQLDASLYVGNFIPEYTSIQHAGLASAMTSVGAQAGFFNGALDEVRIWNYARTQLEIQQTIDSEISSSQTGLISRWGLNEGTGTAATNTISGRPNGALMLTPTWVTPGAPFNLSFTIPSAPSGLTATAISPYKINLAWADNSTNEAAFEVERATVGSGGPFTLLKTLPAGTISTSDSGLTLTTEYWYRVRAVNGGGGSTYSNVANDTTLSPLPPTAPSGLTAIAPSAYQLNLSWSDNSSDENDFQVWRSMDGGVTFTQLTTVSANTVSYTDNAVNSSAQYYYRIRATNASGSSSFTSDVNATTQTEKGAAFQFGGSNAYVTFGLANSLGAQSFSLECWFKRNGYGARTTSGASGVLAIPLITKGMAEGDGSTLDMNYFLGINDTQYVSTRTYGPPNVLVADFEEGTGSASAGLNHPVAGVTPIVNGVWYHAAVTYDATSRRWRLFLNGILEKDTIISTGTCFPQFNSIQHAALGTALQSSGLPGSSTYGPGYLNGIIDEARIWNYARSGSEILSTINSQITTSQSGLVGRWGLNDSTGTTVNGNAGAFLDGTVMGPGYSWVASAPFDVSPPSPPAAPTSLNAITASPYQIDLSWADNSSNETNFEIERSTTGSGGLFTLYATVGPNVTSYSDVLVLPGTEYCYRVRATNLGGNSGYTSSSCATTSSEPTNALQFGSSDAYVTFGPASSLNTPVFTVETWFRRDGSGAGVTTGTGGIASAIPLVTKGTSDTEDTTKDINYFLGIDASTGVLIADFERSPGSQNYPISGVTPISTGQWYHAAATYDGTTWKLYLNGILDSTKSIGPNIYPTSHTTSPAAIGTSITAAGATQGYFNGVLDEVRIWNYARSQVEIWSTINNQITATQSGLIGRWGLNESGSMTVVHASAGTTVNGTLNGSGWSWITGAPFNLTVNQAPNAPTLVTPSNGATDVTTSPTLTVSVSDPDADKLDVNFYGRPTGTAADFTIVELPDAQNYTALLSGGTNVMFKSQTQWIVNSKVSRNIIYVNQVGDITNDGDTYLAQWQRADTTMSILESPSSGIPYGINIGNHDQTGGTNYYNQFFGESRFTGRSYYGGHYGSNNNSNFQLFSTGSLNFIAINLEMGVSASALHWADSLLKAYSSRRALVFYHDMLTTGGAWSGLGQTVYDSLKDNTNLFLINSGHTPGESRRSDTYNSNVVNTLLADYQSRTNGGSGWLRIFEFSPANNVIHVKTYSPYLDQWETDGDSQFDLSYNMSGSTYQFIGTNTGVSSGTSTSRTWSGLSNSTQYEWYTTVNDTFVTTTGPTWNFTTGGVVTTHTITASTAGNGTITPSGAVTVSDGGSQSFAIAANSGNHIDSVVVDGTNQGAITTYPFTNVTSNHIITAYFGLDLITHTITATAVGSGTITPSGAVSVSDGATQSFAITGNSGYHADSVVVDGTNLGVRASYAFTNVATDHTISVYFSANASFNAAYAGVTNLQSVSITAETGEKPQSKVWTYDGRWFCVLSSSAGTHIYRLDGTAWTQLMQLSTATDVHADVKPLGSQAHILLLRTSTTVAELSSVEYVPSTHTYQAWSSRPTNASISLDASVETATIDVDSYGRMWLASDGTTQINVRWSDSPYSSWSSPFSLVTNIVDDDISCIRALPTGQVGVMWSNQNASVKRFGFRMHTDGADPTTWSADEVPASQSTLNLGTGMADDHMNMAVGSDGTIYAAIKTGYDTPPNAKIAMLVRHPWGAWDDLYFVDDAGTRGVAMLNEAEQTITLVYTSAEGYNNIVYRRSALHPVSFGPRQTLMSSGYNNVSTMKQNDVTDVMYVASSASSAVGVLTSTVFPDLVGHWAMDETSGSILADSSTLQNSGSIANYNDTMRVAGVKGRALRFNGTNQYVTVPDTPSLDISGAITIAAWVRPTMYGTQDLVKKAVNGGTNGYEMALATTTSTWPKRVFFRFNQATDGDTYRLSARAGSLYPIDGTWVHYAATYDGTTMKLYINGVLDTSRTASVAIATNNLPVSMGAEFSGARPFKGGLDDVRIYRRALSAGEIAVLTSITRTITASAGPNGSISPSGAVSVPHGTNQAFTIAPSAGHHVDSLIVDGVKVDSTTSYTFVNVTQDHTIRAVFRINQYTITATAGVNGTISPSGAVNVNYGTDQAFAITPSAGHHVDSLIVDGVKVDSTTSYTFVNVTQDHTIRAVFRINQYTITATAGVNGTISPSGAVNVNYGTDQAFAITPSAGHHVDSLIVDGVKVDSTTSYTFVNVTQDHTIRAVFRINQYTITATAGVNGTISPSGAVNVNYGTDQAFAITPSAGHHVDSLIVDGVKVDSTTSYTFVNVTQDHTIRAVFRINQYTITATAGVNGTISPSGAVNVNYGTDQAFAITPSAGHHVDSLIVDGVKVDSTTSYTFVNVTQDHTIRAVFRINQYTITATAGVNGTISPSGAVNVNHGTDQAFAITPSAGHHVDSLIVDGVKVDSTTSYTFVNVTQDHTIRAVFRINQYTITATAGVNGTISPSGAVNVNYGTDQAFAITPSAGHHVDSLIVDGVKVDSTTSYTFVNVTQDHTIRAVFRINQYTITATAGVNGTISPSGAVNVNYGTDQAFAITPSAGHHVDSLIVDGVKVDSTTSYTFVNVTQDHTIRAVFRINQYTITATAGVNGTISPSGVVNVNHGTDQAFAIAPSAGHHVDSLIVDGVKVDSTTSYTFVNVTQDHTIRAVFRINQYTITATAGVNGTISPSGAVNVNYGTDQAFAITPSAGHHVDSLIVDGVKVDSTTSYTFVNVTQDHTIRAVFRINQYTITATAGVNGTISPSGAVNVNYGTDQAFAITPSAGHHVDSLIVDGVKVDSTTSYTFVNVTQDHTIRAVFATNQVTITVDMNLGWNMISNPVTVTNDSVRVLYPTSVNPYAFAFTSGYVQDYTMENGTGYWQKFPSAISQTVNGLPRMRDSISVVTGWNMVGTVSNTVDTSTIVSVPSGLRSSAWFGFSGGYTAVTQLLPGSAYWVKSRAAGKLVLASPLMVGPAKVQSSEGKALSEVLNTVTITDSKGGSQTLYFGADEKNEVPVALYDMPPTPPVGAFDARFSTADGGSMVRTHTVKVSEVVEFPVAIQSEAYPLTITWKVSKGVASYELIDGLGGRIFRAKEMRGEGTMKITSSSVSRFSVKLVGDGQLPKEFALAQNYPNPFNPSTTIKYDLPTDTRVSLKLFNMLGQEVLTLVNEEQKAGYKSVEWNASNFASGVYFYRLEAGSFTSVKKLLLLR